MRAETHFEELKDTSLPLPIWYQDRLAKQWKSGKLILQGKGYACISPDSMNSHGFIFGRFDPRGAPALKMETGQQGPQEEEIPIRAIAALRSLGSTALSGITTMISPPGDNKNPY